jgi:predicted nucleotidyltransferase
MKLEQALDTLRNAEPKLRAKGVCHAAIFGSTARGEQRADSDIDIAVELDDLVARTIYDYVDVTDAVAALFDQPVDVVDRAALKPHLRKRVERELVYAF